MKNLGVMVDCSRNSIMTQGAFRRFIEILEKLDYTSLRLYMEDTYEVAGEPYFGYMRGRFTTDEIRELDKYAAQHGIELIPSIQTLGHLGTLFHWQEYVPINDLADIVMAGEERTYSLIDHLFASLAEKFSSRKVNIGMDEAYLVGRGGYLDRHGLTPPVKIMKEHLSRVLEIADKYGFTCEMWGDMFLHEVTGETEDEVRASLAEIKESVPENIRLIYWDYEHTEVRHYEKQIDFYRALTGNIAFAGGAWTWKGFCPDNRFALSAMESAFRACKNKELDEAYLTMWGDNGGECSVFSGLPILVATSEFAKGNFDMNKIRTRFHEVVGMDFDDFMLLDMPDKFAARDPWAEHNNPTKYYLYQDPFRGLFDSTVEVGKGIYFGEVAAKLEKFGRHPEWGYLFRNLAALSRAVEIKYDLGIRTRNAYATGDREAVRALIPDYEELVQRLEEFYRTFEEYWMEEKKPHGFETQDMRLGGIIKRVLHCKQFLERYEDGTCDRIPELEEKLLDFYGDGQEHSKEPRFYNNHLGIAIANYL